MNEWMDTIDAETARNLLPVWRTARVEATAKIDDGILRLEHIIAADGFARWFEGVPFGTEFDIQTVDGGWGHYELSGGGDTTVSLVHLIDGGRRKIAKALKYDEILRVEKRL